MATGIFSTLFQERMPGVKFPWPYSGSKKTPSFDSPWFGRSYGAFAIVDSTLVSLESLIHRYSRDIRLFTRRMPSTF